MITFKIFDIITEHDRLNGSPLVPLLQLWKRLKLKNCLASTYEVSLLLHRKLSFLLRISSVNVTNITFTEEIPNGKLYFLYHKTVLYMMTWMQIKLIKAIIVKLPNICNSIGWNSVHISDIFNCYRANINGMGNAGKLGGIYTTFKFTLT